MDTGLLQAVFGIVAIVAVVEFFHIGYLVNSINKKLEKQTRYLQLMHAASSGQTMVGRTGTSQSYMEAGAMGKVLIDGEVWDCKAKNRIGSGSNVRVTAIDGLSLVVEFAR